MHFKVKIIYISRCSGIFLKRIVLYDMEKMNRLLRGINLLNEMQNGLTSGDSDGL